LDLKCDRQYATKRVTKLPLLKDGKIKSKYDSMIRKAIEVKKQAKFKKATTSKPTSTNISKAKPINLKPTISEKSIFGTASFEDLNLRPEIIEALKSSQIHQPTWIQVRKLFFFQQY
jgi:hypothetical protein